MDNKALVKLWIDLSFDDLKSSRLLYDNSHYRTSYFFFQQAVEKANKVFGLVTDQITEKDFLEIGHDQIKIYRRGIVKKENEIKVLIKALDNYKKIKDDDLLGRNTFEIYQNSLNTSLRYIDGLKDKDLVKIPISDLEGALRELHAIERTKLWIPDKVDNKFKKIITKLANWMGNFETPEALLAQKQFLELLNNKKELKHYYKATKRMLHVTVDLSFICATLASCAVITIQHSSRTRYPTKGDNPFDIYTINLPLIQKQEKFMNLLEKALSKLNDFVNDV